MRKWNEDWAGDEVRIGRVTWMPSYSSTGWSVEIHIGVRARWDPYELKKHPFITEYRKMAELEALKVKFACFKGIGNPTHFQ